MAELKARMSGWALLKISILCLFVSPAWSEGVDYAQMLPKASQSLLLDIVAAGRRFVSVGERGHILYSDDQGRSWVQARVPTSVMLTRVFFVNDSLGWAVGHDGNILFTHDGGVTWVLQRNGLTDQQRINEERVARIKTEIKDLRNQSGTETAEDELQSRLEDAESRLGLAQEVLNEPVFPPPLMDIWFANEERGWAVGAFGVLLYTSNGGSFWDDWSYKVSNPDELHFNGVTADAEGTLYLASEWGYVFRSVNGGQSWEGVETGYDGSYFGILVNPGTGSVFAYGLRGTIYRSRDQGLNWEALSSQTQSSLFGATATDDGVLMFVGKDGAVVYSDDDGEQFSRLQVDGGKGLNGVVEKAAGKFLGAGEGGVTELTIHARAGG